ncbi:EAL domain-containing protein (putative c-di-GMP-specific phosphodiesterase class I) [Pseudomonas fluorescens]|jgi:EAL domain-containing protein (putative c-di-GMP-specific phosphodiesterase class I)|nr:EAL domain-containing protein (putative c-di-GMP-specific phosphodiesterase class I) [Pseudomonas fluorescens]
MAFDDFGIDFSSLKLPYQLPFTQIKLDSAFAKDFQKPENKAVINSSLSLAKSLSMDLTIEGVTNQLEHEALLNIGCVYG